MRLLHTNGSPNLGQKASPHSNQKQKKKKKREQVKLLIFAVPAVHRIKLKDSENKDKYLNLGAFGTVTKGLLKGVEDLKIRERVETIQATALLRTARILRRVLETWGDLLSFKLQGKTIS